MRHLATILMIAAAIAPIASAQTLADRIAAVRRQHEVEKAARSLGDTKTSLLQVLFYKKIDVDFEDLPARDVFEYLKTALDIDLRARYLDDRAGFGIDPETPITLQVEDAIVVDVLNQVLELCSDIESCTWQLRDAFIEVGTKERLALDAAQEVRTYPIADLLYEAPRFENAPPAGFSRGYPGWIGGYDGDTTVPRGVYPGLYGGRSYYRLSRQSGYVPNYDPQVDDDRDLNSDEKKAERAKEVIDLITGIIEPMAWTDNGGTWASIRYHGGTLVVRAPDFIQREIGGYPPVPPPQKEEAPDAAEPSAPKESSSD